MNIMAGINPPDFEEMLGMIDVIRNLNAEVQIAKVDLDVAEAETVKKASTDKSLSPDGKYLSVTFINSTYKITGINGELVAKRRELARKSAELDKAYKLFDVMKMQFDAWRTDQANNRKVTF
jgi:hypothetical protein